MDRTIAVSGTGRISIAPDEAKLSIGVEARAANARETSNIANSAMNSLIAALKANGVADRDIQTGFFRIQPNYEMIKNVRKQVGHTANNTVNVTIRATGSVSTIIDATIEAAEDRITINNLNFNASNEVLSNARNQARTAALVDARNQAEAIAQTMGVTLGDVITVDTTPQQVAPRPMYAARAMMAGGATPIEEGEVEVVANATVIFAIA